MYFNKLILNIIIYQIFKIIIRNKYNYFSNICDI